MTSRLDAGYHLGGHVDSQLQYRSIGPLAQVKPADASTVGRAVDFVRPRRNRTGTVGAAYSHALAMTGSVEQACSITSTALSRGGKSRVAVLAQARHLAGRATPAEADLGASTHEDLAVLALQLSHSRPLIERQIVDFELRYGLDRGTTARVLGISSTRARARSEQVEQAWAAHLDPAMMAKLGPGTCEQLATILKEADLIDASASTRSTGSLAPTGTEAPAAGTTAGIGVSATIGQLLDVAPRVHEHVDTCDNCEQRLRTMTSVRSLVGRVPVADVPAEITALAKTTGRRLTAPLPPSIEPRRLDVRRLRTVGVVAVGVVIVVGLALGALDAVVGNDDSQAARVARLIDTAPESSILATPSVITDAVTAIALANNSEVPVDWSAVSGEESLTIFPASGRLEPGRRIAISVEATLASDTTIEISASDGSRQTVRYQG